MNQALPQQKQKSGRTEIVILGAVHIVNVSVHRMRVFLLQWTQSHWRVRPEPKPRIKRFSECGVEGVEVDQWARGHSVEGQSASRTVHKHCCSVRDRREGGGGVREDCLYVIVPDSITITIRALQTPGLIITPKQTVITASFPFDSFVCDCYINLSFPFNLPVTATSQTIFTQQLKEFIESLLMIRIWLLLSHHRHAIVVVRQFQASVDCVWVQCEFTQIWCKEKTKHSNRLKVGLSND